MKFEETDCIIVPETPKCFVYLLIDENDEVIYVGQTRRGMIRPMEHRGKGWLCRVAIIPCEQKMLDVKESMLIEKYTPKNNKQPGRVNSSMMAARNAIRTNTMNDDYSLNDLKSDIDLLGIQPFVIDLKACLRAKDVEKIINYRNGE